VNSHNALDNRRRQHVLVSAHKRKIRDEIRPQLMETKREWYVSSKNNNKIIKERWHTQKTRVRNLQREQKLLHRTKILAHKKRIREQMARR